MAEGALQDPFNRVMPATLMTAPSIDRDPAKSSRGTWLTGIAFALVIGYPLSIGPLVYLDGRGFIADRFLVLGYYCMQPIEWLSRNVPGFSESCGRYLNWWYLLGRDHRKKSPPP